MIKNRLGLLRHASQVTGQVSRAWFHAPRVSPVGYADIRRKLAREAAPLVAEAAPIKEMRFHRRLRSLFSCSSSLASRWANPLCPRFRSVCIARAIFFASLFTRPLFIPPTRKPRAGLNTRVNPIRCKCFRARPSPLSSPVSLSLIGLFCREAFSSQARRDASRTGLTFTGVYARGLKLDVAEGCTITSSWAEGRNKFARWKRLSHILLLSPASHLHSFSLSLYSPSCNLGRRAKFIHSPANPVTAYFTYREGGSRANVLDAFLNTCIDGTATE